MYKALVSFSGKLSMSKGQVREIKDNVIVEDLLRAGYIEEVKPTKKDEVKPTKKKKEEE
jgi:hypothetical protein